MLFPLFLTPFPSPLPSIAFLFDGMLPPVESKWPIPLSKWKICHCHVADMHGELHQLRRLSLSLPSSLPSAAGASPSQAAASVSPGNSKVCCLYPNKSTAFKLVQGAFGQEPVTNYEGMLSTVLIDGTWSKQQLCLGIIKVCENIPIVLSGN